MITLTGVQADIADTSLGTGGFAGLIHLGSGDTIALNKLTIDADECASDHSGYSNCMADQSVGGCRAKCSESRSILELEPSFTQAMIDDMAAGGTGTVGTCTNEALGTKTACEAAEDTDGGQSTWKGFVERCPTPPLECDDDQKKNWIIAYAPAFSNRLGVLMYAPTSCDSGCIDETIADLEDTVSGTSGTIIGLSVAICGFVALFTWCMLRSLINGIARPLKMIENVSTAIVETSANESRDMSHHFSRIEDVPKGDELGELVYQFKLMVKGLHDADVKKKVAPKYPQNEIYHNEGNRPWRAPLGGAYPTAPPAPPHAPIPEDTPSPQRPPQIVNIGQALSTPDEATKVPDSPPSTLRRRHQSNSRFVKKPQPRLFD